MKDQASLNLLIVDSPIDSKALAGHLMLRATSTGLKVYDVNGSEQELGGGASSWNELTDKPTYLTVPVNTANGLVQLGSDGKIPSNLYDAGGGTTIDWSNVNAELISFSADSGMGFSSYGRISISGGDLLINTSSINFGEAGGTVITFDLVTLDDLKIFHADTATTSTPNTAGGFAIVESNGKLPASIIPESSGGGTSTEIDWSAVSTPTVSLTATDATFQITATQNDISLNAQNGSGGIHINAANIFLKTHGLNQPEGLVKLGADGKIPSNLYDAGSGGGAETLIYRVVASATEPESPTEGMIWIKTE